MKISKGYTTLELVLWIGAIGLLCVLTAAFGSVLYREVNGRALLHKVVNMINNSDVDAQMEDHYPIICASEDGKKCTPSGSFVVAFTDKNMDLQIDKGETLRKIMASRVGGKKFILTSLNHYWTTREAEEIGVMVGHMTLGDIKDLDERKIVRNDISEAYIHRQTPL